VRAAVAARENRARRTRRRSRSTLAGRRIGSTRHASRPAAQEEAAVEHNPSAGSSDEQQGLVKISAEDIEAAGIEVASVQGGTIARRIIVPSTIRPPADRIAHVAVKLSGIVAELWKKVGDPVAADEVLAILESREVANAKSEYLAARVTNELQQEMLNRDTILWDRKVIADQQLLRSRNPAANAKITSDTARQKLFALGLTETEIVGLPNEPEALLRRQEIRSPIAGHVVERKVELGVAVGRDQLETELFVVADLDHTWAELAVSPEEVAMVRIGQIVSVAARGIAEKTEGQVIYISPIVDRDTHKVHVVAEIDNKNGIWRPGSFVIRAIASKKSMPPPIGWLTRAEMEAMLAGPDRKTDRGRSEYALLLFLYNTGARVSEATYLKVRDLQIGRRSGGHDLATLHGKGGKTRQCPLWPETERVLTDEIIGRAAEGAVFVSRLGTPFTRFGVYRLAEAQPGSV
jgi:membrane fusion protein, heavy metal efflux system